MHRHAAVLLLLAAPAAAQEIVTHPFDGDVADAAFVLEIAIEGEGLTIDNVSHVGEMLERTGADLGAGPSPVGPEAVVMQFCSATVSREVMEADPLNVAHCPYGLFAARIDGATVIGHRTYAETSMAPVNALLARIAQAALD